MPRLAVLNPEGLAAGDSLTAMKWLDVAHALNPALDQVLYYHIELPGET